MVAKKLLITHNDGRLIVDYDTEDGLEVLKYQLFSLTLIPPEDQRLESCNNQEIQNDEDLHSAPELRLVGISGGSVSIGSSTENSDEQLAKMLQAEEDAIFFQQFHSDEGKLEFQQRIRPYISQVLLYEDQVRQEAARNTVPMDELEEKALVSLAKDGNFEPSNDEKDHAVLLQLLFWFKKSFRWVNSPPCDSCAGESCSIGMGIPVASELQFGASRVELHRCKTCSKVVRFPRYNDPLKLIETRSGRCGEWANCFTLYCRSLGYDSRLTLDFSDHLWTECFSNSLGRWMHLDPCEGVYDNPLLYEKGWGKKLSYIIALSKDGLCDVTRRYTRKWSEILQRRQITSEENVHMVISELTNECHRGLSPQQIIMIEERDRKEMEELRKGTHIQDELVSLPERRSGDKEWRLARSEASSDKISLGFLSCPVRVCVDDHVSCIYNVLYALLTEFTDAGISKVEALEYLCAFKELISDLRTKPFRERRSIVKPSSSRSKVLKLCTMPSMKFALSSLFLNMESELDDQIHICSSDPVRTALALPVILDSLDEILQNIASISVFSNASLNLPLVRPNRISSGSVIASGEELPFGISTSAFDGLFSSKWEEPNGAKGCWLEYRTLNGEMCDLQAYELMSGDDSPERDPMDWIVEGSSDMGCSWVVLDSQCLQIFQTRFMRKAFTVDPSKRCKSNAFRFRFLSVRDSKATSRMQIGSIDLYTS